MIDILFILGGGILIVPPYWTYLYLRYRNTPTDQIPVSRKYRKRLDK